MPRRSRPEVTKEQILDWLVDQHEEDIQAVLLSLSKDPDCPHLDLDGDPAELLDQLEGTYPTRENLLSAIDDALGLDEQLLTRIILADPEEPAEENPDPADW